MLLMFKNSYKAFEEKSVSFVTETTYLEWNTTFPAVTLCPIAGSEPEWFEDEDFDKEEIDMQKQFIIDLVYFTGSCYSCNSDCKSCKSMNFTEKVEKYRKKCNRVVSACKWNDIDFNCCDEILPLETEYGFCYSLNSLHTKKPNGQKMDLTMNRKTGPGELWLRTNEDIRVFFHAPEDVPFINSDPDQRKDVMLGEVFNISVNVIEISNDENVYNIPVYKRGCKFPWENEELVVHDHYSYSTCVVQCHAENHIELCNCTHHLMPKYNRIKYCDMEGLKCLTDNFETVNRLHAKGTGLDKPGLVCDCLPSCVEPEYKVVSDTKVLKTAQSEINIRMQSLPNSRFKRIVIRTTLDLVVSIGGTAGLFIGASLLSGIETIYLLCLRKKAN
ncbi:sodium channel protein Nach isoform X1 [Leptinotarsa decemlineata]|uniref:sodium channel protein Nach isoform X1 n=1 Tax=Leptinotarsa decemlineata TaxID=7539 RepID=UPI000C2551F9|nr:pickpocket protein 11-like [Leptinotarsa decemlineata]